MNKAAKKRYIILATVLCALVMSIVDAFIQPGYAVKSAVKLALFLLLPLGCFARGGELKQRLKALFVPRKRDLVLALLLGLGLYGLILGLYFLLGLVIDIPAIGRKLMASSGVNGGNFGGIFLYIALVNSLLEEFLFRGFAFLSLKELTGRRFACWFSAIVFAAYHCGMMAGSMSLPVWLLAMAGLVIAGLLLNYINEKSGSLIPSWLVHMFANFGINTIGVLIFAAK